MLIELHHRPNGTLEITVPGCGYAAPRVFGWYSDAVSVLMHNYGATLSTSVWVDATQMVEIWESELGEVLHPAF